MKLLGSSRRPFVGLALAVTAGIVTGEFIRVPVDAIAVGFAVFAVIGLLLLWRPNGLCVYAFVFCSFVFLHNLRTTATPGLSLAAKLGERPRVVTVTGAVVSEPKSSEGGKASFLLQLNSIEFEGRSEPNKATVMIRWKGTVAFGDEFRFFGTAAPLAPPRNPGEFDMRAYLARRDVRRVVLVRYAEDATLIRSGGGNPMLRFAQQSRNWLQSTICRGLDDSPEVKDFIGGITLGLRHQTAEDIEEPFQQTGTLHLFAVAGLHVGIVAELLWILGGAVGAPKRWAAVAIIPLVLFYSTVTGLHVSSVRAAVMSSVFMGGFMVERKVFTLNSLAAAAVLLLTWNTNDLFSTGFQLSFAVVSAIVILADPLTKWFRRYTAPDPFLPRQLFSRRRRMADPVIQSLSQSASISTAAWIGSLVLLYWYFYLVTPVSLVANLVVVPIAFFILAVALLSILTAPLLPWLAIVFNNANWFLAKLVIAIVQLFAAVPAGHYYLPHPPGLGDAQAKITVLDVASGATIHLQTRKQDWLFDCGSEKGYERILRQYLHSAGVNDLSTLMLTHGDSQHIGGATRLLADLSPVILIDNPAHDRSSIHKRLRHLFDERRLKINRPVQGDVLPTDRDVSCAVLYPPRDFSASAGDDQALVSQLQFAGGLRILLMSDSGFPTEQALLKSGIDLHSDIVIKGQHHSGKSGSVEFLDAVRPQLIVGSSRDFPAHERIDDQWADLVRGREIKLFKQSDSGAVEIFVRAQSWEARAYATGETFRSSTR
jgi:competence protein ComEC